MSARGLSKPALDRFDEAMARYVERADVPGLVALVSRDDDVHVAAIGTKAVDGDDAMSRDTIFRIASMSKPITAAAAMSLIEEGRLGLDESIEVLIPELADRQVMRRLDGPLDDTVPAERAITVRDLLAFTMGYGAVFAPPLGYPIQRAHRERRLGGDAPPQPATIPEPNEWLRLLAELPLMYQPGETFAYHTGSDVLGVLLARLTGQSLESVLNERVFEPLGMTDTAFSVPADKRRRLATSYDVDFETGELVLFDGVDDSQWGRPPPFESGGGGLVGTVDDYLVFTRMLLHQGEGHLTSASVESMTTNQLTNSQQPGVVPYLGDEGGWGFGVATQPGRYGWNGGLGTTWWTYPDVGLIAILLTQRTAFPHTDPLHVEFATLARETVDD